MKCNYKHCKYYEPAEHENLFGTIIIKNAGCKFPYCKVERRKKK